MDAAPSFGAELRRLRTERGTSLAGLSERTHYSKGYLSKLETGAKRASAELAARLDEALAGGGRLVELVAAENRPVCPYRGLEPYGAADAEWFSAARNRPSTCSTARWRTGGPSWSSAHRGWGSPHWSAPGSSRPWPRWPGGRS